MLKINNSEELKSLFPEITEKKLSQLLVVCSCMLAVQSTNLSKCAKRLCKIIEEPIKYDTAYSRLKRFFQTGAIDGIRKGICLLVINTLGQTKDCYLILDRTNWEMGKVKINLLVIGLLYKNVFIPLAWKDLGKKGNSSTKERLDLVDKLIDWWKESDVPLPQLYLSGDREFIGYLWLKGLELRGVKFVMRIRANSKIELWLNGKIKDRKLELKIIKRYLFWAKIDNVEAVLNSDYIVKLTALKNGSTRAKAETIYLMTNMEDIKRASAFYKKRYKIEVCFKHLKRNGFNLEDLKVEGAHKVELMFGVLTMIYLMAIQKGIVHFEENVQEMKLFVDKTKKDYCYKMPAKSVFMKGCEILMEQVFFLSEFCIELMRLSRWIAKPLDPLICEDYTLQKIIVQ